MDEEGAGPKQRTTSSSLLSIPLIADTDMIGARLLRFTNKTLPLVPTVVIKNHYYLGKMKTQVQFQERFLIVVSTTVKDHLHAPNR